MQHGMLLATCGVVRGHIHDAPVLAEEIAHVLVDVDHPERRSLPKPLTVNRSQREQKQGATKPR